MRKYNFRPQTCLLVMGVVASAYAFCYTQVTSGTAVCFYSGDSVDSLAWPSLGPGGSTTVIATADWVKGKQTGTVQDGKNFLNAYSTGGAGNGSYSPWSRRQ